MEATATDLSIIFLQEETVNTGGYSTHTYEPSARGLRLRYPIILEAKSNVIVIKNPEKAAIITPDIVPDNPMYRVRPTP